MLVGYVYGLTEQASDSSALLQLTMFDGIQSELST